jgi:methylenetetrahydrofolate reductase (NADPH)
MTKVVDHIKSANGKTLFSFEILPPVKGDNFQKLITNIEPLMEFKPKFIDVTYHREEYVYKIMENGLLEKRTVRKRPGTVGICAALMHRFHIDTIPHIICGGFSKEETENALIDLSFLGIDNVLALRGDAIKSEKNFTTSVDGHNYASDLVTQVLSMNNGQYLDEDQRNTTETDFCIGVAGYPEKHFEAPNLKIDLQFLKKKIDLGAEYIVTQMFFDNAKYFKFVDDCRAAGITVPIIPGLKPITTKKQLTILPSIFHIDLPEQLAEAVYNCETTQAVRQVGVEWCTHQSKELMQKGAPVLHYYSMGKSTSIQQIASNLF